MTEEIEEVPKTLQQKIREKGKVVHADDEINEDGLPVYFQLEIADGYFLVLDMIKKNEMGIKTPDEKYQTVHQFVAEMIYEMSRESRIQKKQIKDLEKENKKLNDELIEKLTQPLPFQKPDNPWIKPDVYFSHPSPHTITPEEPDKNTPMLKGDT